MPAFPVHANTITRTGLTKREHFAALAMQGIITGSYHQNEGWDQNGIDTMARDAVSFADALLAELSKS